MMLLENLPVARYELQFQVTQPFELPDYAGSTLRGGFGRALRKICCMTKLEDCKTCPLYRTCPYTNIFETPAPESHQIQKFSQVPNGYIIEPPSWGRKYYRLGEVLRFNLVLMGNLVEQLPLITFAFKRAGEYNIAGGKAALSALSLLAEKESIPILLDDKIIEHSTILTFPKKLSSNLELEILTPLRLQENGKPLTDKTISLERFLISLAKRIALLCEFHYQPLNLDFDSLIASIPQITQSRNLKWLDWARYSSRQQQKMKLGGLVGQWHLHNVPEDWAKLLYLGQWLHNGKNATFGLGKYKITNL
ncbi:CRISPR system precrRNA processing endoribonuclease RAMP protein Cas6 [Avibacterium volantium]|uniref:CRISPR system precrRNA processing endoribonuclease RAMP protein Cas6 n=1 Tax=Avibacterium TaxID=292486 RepID=UPI003BF795A5